MPFEAVPTELPGVVLVTPRMFPDSRGFFAEVFKSSDFVSAGCAMTVRQVNHSRSSCGVLRGLHYQLPPHAQAKLVSVVRGEIWDVAVDIRRGSPGFGRWVAERLSEENHRMLYIPEGFAHGFCVLSEVAEIIYYCSTEYAPASERCILWNDPALGISWPVKEPLLSGKDALGKPLADAENTFE